MKQPPMNICPLLAISDIGRDFTSKPAECIYDRCAFWDFFDSGCAIVTAAIAIREVAENLEALAAKSQASGNLDKKAARSANDTTDGKVEQTLTGPASASNDT